MYYTPPQVAKLLKVRREKVVGWIKTGKLRAIDVGGERSLYRIPQAALDDFERATQVTPPKSVPRRQPSQVPDYFG
jgi:excisionase family DNA binding protein